MSVEPLLRAEALTKTYGPRTALSNASFSLLSGEVRSLVGANGAGKSTLIKILTGAITPDEGKIFVDGRQLPTGSPIAMLKGGISCIYQHSNLAPDLSVLDNIFLGRQHSNRFGFLDRRAQRQAVRDLLDMHQIDLDPQAIVRDLPAGKQKEVEIAKALATNARVLLMDEPTAWLSGIEVGNLFLTIRQLKASGVGVVYISHVLDEIFAICDSLTILRDGKIVGDSAVADITREELVRKFIGDRLAGAALHRRERAADVQMIAKPSVLRVSNLTKTGVFEDVSFEVGAGELLCITGLIGSKRTELVRTIFGADSFDSGTIHFKDRPFWANSPADAIRKGMGFVPEDRHRDGLMMSLTMAQNLVASALGVVTRWGLIDRRRMAATAARQIDELDIRPNDPRKTVSQLSGGNQQKVLIGKWMVKAPDLLILDEPTVGVDLGAKAEIYSLLQKLKAAGAGLLVVSSDMEEVMDIADRIMVMRSGRVQGTYRIGDVDEAQIVAYMAGPDDAEE